MMSQEFENYYLQTKGASSWETVEEAQKLETKNWKLKITGLVEKPLTFEVEDLMNKFIAKSIQGTAYLEGEKDKNEEKED